MTAEELQLIEHAKLEIVRFNAIRHDRGGQDTLYSFLRSDSGSFFAGASFEPNIAHATVCAERCAIATMVLEESYSARIRHIVVADPVPFVQPLSTPPCGTCRHLVWSFGSAETSVILMQYVQSLDGWTFPTVERLLIGDLYPFPYEPKSDLWDGWEPS